MLIQKNFHVEGKGRDTCLFSLSLPLPPSIIIVNCICPPGALIWLINLFLFLYNTGLLKFENDVNLICKCFLLIRLRTPLRNMFLTEVEFVYMSRGLSYVSKRNPKICLDKMRNSSTFREKQMSFACLILYCAVSCSLSMKFRF
jgi:hypothetical protein